MSVWERASVYALISPDRLKDLESCRIQCKQTTGQTGLSRRYRMQKGAMERVMGLEPTTFCLGTVKREVSADVWKCQEGLSNQGKWAVHCYFRGWGWSDFRLQIVAS